MKKNNFFAALIAAVVAVVLVGCGREAEAVASELASPTPTPLVTTVVVKELVTPAPSVVVDIDESQLLNGELIIWTTKTGFYRVNNVVDYCELDATNVTGRRDEVVAMFITRGQGERTSQLWAVFNDGLVGEIVSPGGYYDHRLPFGCVDSDVVLRSPKEDDSHVVLAIRQGSYYIGIYGKYHRISVEGALDYSMTYDAVYWLMLENGELVAYRLAWYDPEAEPEVYFRGCNALSHFVDEAQGCLVAVEEANSHYYNRWDLFTPYPNKKD